MTDSALKKMSVFLTETEHRQAKSKLALEGLSFQDFFSTAVRRLLSGQDKPIASASTSIPAPRSGGSTRDRRAAAIDAWLYNEKPTEGDLMAKRVLAEALGDEDLKRFVRQQAEVYYAGRRK